MLIPPVAGPWLLRFFIGVCLAVGRDLLFLRWPLELPRLELLPEEFHLLPQRMVRLDPLLDGVDGVQRGGMVAVKLLPMA
jgi:hypothetical protein